MQKTYECLKVDLLFIPNIFKIDNFEKIVQKSNNNESYFKIWSGLVRGYDSSSVYMNSVDLFYGFGGSTQL